MTIPLPPERRFLSLYWEQGRWMTSTASELRSEGAAIIEAKSLTRMQGAGGEACVVEVRYMYETQAVEKAIGT